jgi:hypothetical protein
MKYLPIILLILSLLLLGKIYAQQKTLDDLVEIKDNVITLKCSLSIPILNIGTARLSKGTVITIEE